VGNAELCPSDIDIERTVVKNKQDLPCHLLANGQIKLALAANRIVKPHA
jgi:hypothetical protein